MAAAFRSIASTTYASRANTSVSAPAGIANDDILIASIFIGGSGTPPTPTLTGFTQIGSATSNTVAGFTGKLYVFWKRAASESGSYTFSHTTDSTQACVIAVSGCITSGSPVDVNSTNTGTGTTSTATGVTTTAANDFLLYIAHDWEGLGALNPPTGFTERLDGLLYAATALQASAGASGNKTQTNGNTNGSEAWAACLIALKEDTGGAPSGTLAATETADTAALAGNTGPQGTLSSTEGADTAAVAAKTGPSGTLAATETTDTAALSGSVFIGGSLAATEAADAASLSGTVSYTGTFAATDATDVAALSGNTGAAGTLAVTEATDTAAFTSTSNVSGSLSVTESSDVASLSGNAGSAGTLSATDVADSASVSGASGVTGTLATTDAQDTASVSGNAGANGTLSAAEAADAASLSGNFDVSGSLVATDSPDVAAFSSSGVVSGELAASEDQDTASFVIAPTFATNPLERLKMYTGSMGSVSNREDWIVNISLVGDDGTSFDLTDAEIFVYVSREDAPNCAILTASLGDGVALTDSYTMQWHFTESQMESLCPRQYGVYCRIERDDITTQLLAANVAIVEGGPKS